MANDPNAGNRQPLVNATPTLIIGLGGTGAEVLARLRDRFYSTFGPLDRLPVVRYLWLDTDVSQTEHTSTWYKNYREGAKHLEYGSSEQLSMTVMDTNVYLNYLPQHPQIERWIYPHLSGRIRLDQGAGQIRAYGRLGFFANAGRIRSHMQNALSAVMSPANRQIAERNHVGVSTDRINVIIVASLAGGTGSGTFLDTAYMLRHVLGQVSSNYKTTVLGYLALPRIFGGPYNLKRHYANGYAAFKELNHYYYSPPAIREHASAPVQRSAEHDFVRWWAPGDTRDEVAVAPFDMCYLVDAANPAFGTVSGAEKETLFSMIAETIYHDFSISGFGTTKRSEQVNLLTQVVGDNVQIQPMLEVGEVKLPKSFFSFGLSAIVFPTDRVRKACAARLSGDVVRYWLRESDDEMGAADYLSRVFLPRLGMEESADRHQAFDALYASGVGGTTVEQLMAQRVMEAVDRVQSQGPGADGESWGELLRVEVDKLDRLWDGESEKSTDPRDWGDMVSMLRRNQKNYAEQLEKKLQELVEGLVSSEHRGIGFAVLVLEDLHHLLTKDYGYLDTWRAEQERLSEGMKGQREVMEHYRQQLVDHWEMSPVYGLRSITLKHLLGRFREAALEAYRARVQHMARVCATQVGQAVLAWIGDGSKAEDATGWRSDLGRMSKNLTTLGAWLEERVEAYTSSTPDVRQISLYEGEKDLADIYKRYVPDPFARAKEFNGDALTALGPGGLMGLTAPLHDYAAVCNELMRVVSPCFAALAADYDAFTLFHKKYPVGSPEWRGAIDAMVRACRPWVAWETANTGVTDQGGGDRNGFFVLGLASHPDDPRYAAFKKQVAETWGNEGRYFDADLAARDQIIFYSEVAGFALCQISATKIMREEYQRVLVEGAKDLHTDKRDSRFAEAVVVQGSELDAVRIATRAFLLGTMLGLVKASPFRDTRGNPNLTYSYWQPQPGLAAEEVTLGFENYAPLYLRNKPVILNSLSTSIAMGLSELQSNVETWAEFAALLRYWIEQECPVQRVEVGNGVIENIYPLEHQVLRSELQRIMNGMPPQFQQLQTEKWQRIADFTGEDPAGHRVLKETPVGQEPGNSSWQTG